MNTIVVVYRKDWIDKTIIIKNIDDDKLKKELNDILNDSNNRYTCDDYPFNLYKICNKLTDKYERFIKDYHICAYIYDAIEYEFGDIDYNYSMYKELYILLDEEDALDPDYAPYYNNIELIK